MSVEYASLPNRTCGNRGDGPTERQWAIYMLIFESVLREGRQPTVRELMAAAGLRSPTAIMHLLRPLARKGWISLSDHSSRSVVFLKGPDGKPFRGFAYPAEGEG